ncbi:hypothetical protein GCM10009739_28120 [Microbacterium ulmi]
MSHVAPEVPSYLFGMDADTASNPWGLEPLLDVGELAAYLGVPVSMVYDWRTRGLGPRAHRFGKHLKLAGSDVRIWIEQQRELDAHEQAGGDPMGRARVIPALHRKCRELGRHDPSLGPIADRHDVTRAAREPHHVVHVGGCLGRRESQVGRAEFDQLPAGSQSDSRKRRGRRGSL